MNWLLDTDTCIDALRHRPFLLRRFRALSPDDVAVATMTEAELWYGAWRSRDPAGARQSVASFLAPLVRLPFDSEAAERHAELRFALRAQPVGERDLVIASVGMAQGAGARHPQHPRVLPSAAISAERLAPAPLRVARVTGVAIVVIGVLAIARV